MISFVQHGDLRRTKNFLIRNKKLDYSILHKYGREGVEALSRATPVDTGLTANSWYYKINQNGGSVSLQFFNSNVQNGVPIAIIVQYGHGTGTGGYVQGIDYINPSIRPIFEDLLNEMWREVRRF